MKSLYTKIGILVLMAVAFRVILAVNAQCISNDGPEYIYVAQLYYNCDFKTAIDHSYQPLYPILTAFSYFFAGNWETAALIPSIVLSSLALVFLYLICRRIFDEKTAFVASVLYIAVPFPAILSSQILTTGTFIFFFLATFWLGIELLITNKWYYYLLTTLGSIFCYLVRPDGILILVPFVFTIIISNILALKANWKKLAVSILMFIIPVIIVFGIYLIAADKNITDFIPKKISQIALTSDFLTLPEFLRHEETPPFIGDETYLWALLRVFNIFIGTCPHVVFLLLLFGIFKRRIYKYQLLKEIPFLLLFVTYWIFMVIFIMFLFGYVSRRHFAPVVALALPWAAVGLMELASRIKSTAYALERREIADYLPSKMTLYVLIALLLVMFSIKTFPPLYTDKTGERKAGEFLKEQYHGRKFAILTNMNRISYYADVYNSTFNITSISYDPVTKLIPYNTIIQFVKSQGIEIIAIDNTVDKFCPDFFENARKGVEITIVHPPIPKSNHTDENSFISIYKVNR